jgi:hypothetical protein
MTSDGIINKTNPKHVLRSTKLNLHSAYFAVAASCINSREPAGRPASADAHSPP